MSMEPYSDATEHLEDELGRYLPLRAERINAEQEGRLASHYEPDRTTIGEKQRPAVVEAERRARTLRRRENEVRAEIDARLEATRKMQGEAGIDLDRLNHGLTFDARLVLLALTAAALGMSQDVLGGLGRGFWDTLAVSEVMMVLDARSIVDRLKARRLLMDLAMRNLIILDYRWKQVAPQDFSACSVALTRQAFSVILNDPELENEGIGSDNTGDH